MRDNRNLTARYTVHQIVYWVGYCSVFSYAATLLLSKGIPASYVGLILFGANFFSFLLQPIIGSIADKSKKNIIPLLLAVQSAISSVCFFIVFFFQPSNLVMALLLLVGSTLFDMGISLMNSANVFYNQHGWNIDYGLGRGLGSLGYAITSLALGYIIASKGTKITVLFSACSLFLLAVICITYPKQEKKALPDNETNNASASLAGFFGKYKWYTISVAGVFCLAVVHVMIENYLIEICTRLGGNSSSVGKALFIATVTETPMMIFFPRIFKKFGAGRILVISSCSFLVKSLLFLSASSLSVIYLTQTIQCISYTFLAASEVFYSQQCICESDLVKGQSVITASYALGCASGNLLGGVLISASGVPALLTVASVFSVVGIIIMKFCVPKALKYSLPV